MADPKLKINGKEVKYEPNTFSFSPGESERKFFADTGGNITSTDDKSTAISMVKFELRSRSENIALFEEWKSYGLNNTVTFTDADLQKNMPSPAIENVNEEITIGSDSTFPVIFRGKQMPR